MKADLSLQTLRGLACLLLVAYHVVGDDASRGLRLADGWLRDGNDALACLRMPLFTFLSGVVYGMRPLSGDLLRFMRGKTRRLLVPMLVIGTFYALVQSQGVGVNAVRFEWRTLHIEPVDHYWFVEALFWVFLLVGSIEVIDGRRLRPGLPARLLDHPVGLAVLWGAAALFQLTVNLPRTLGLEGASYLLPYFVAGMALVRLGGLESLTSVRARGLLLVGAVLAVSMLGPVHPNPERRTLAMLAAGTVLCLLCVALRPRLDLLARIGSGSYAIYLMHVFFTAGSRVALTKLGVQSVELLFVVGLACGIGGPLLLQSLARRTPLSALLLLGESERTAARRSAALQAARP
ncbi:MAG: hypothetical protein RIQ60_2013 [Pseudomonadota bacterium]|jgi:fucose 4-O-acetylase-like acetyltransferase